MFCRYNCCIQGAITCEQDNQSSAEVCDTLDNDCNGQVDEGIGDTYYLDIDLDNFGVANDSIMSCAPTGSHTALIEGDCNDTDPAINPAATEVCDGVDNDCDNQVDENYQSTNCTTGQQGVCSAGTTSCIQGAITCEQDNQSSAEVCDTLDNDCNGQVDEGIGDTYYLDIDLDNFGVANDSIMSCAPTGSHTALIEGDCNDTDPAINPAATEVCDGVDNDCDNQVDENYQSTNCTTGQQGVCSAGTTSCIQGAITCEQDNQSSAEVCDTLDNDCNGQVDEGIGDTYYLDIDLDNFGVANDSIMSCAPTGSHTALIEGDCNDTDPAINPAATEVCDSVDNDCDTQIDEDFNLGMACGFGQCFGTGTNVCDGNGGVTCGGQTGGTTEICDGVDNDCDGLTDEDFDFQSDPDNCGTCGNSCDDSGNDCSVDTCASGACVVYTCSSPNQCVVPECVAGDYTCDYPPASVYTSCLSGGVCNNNGGCVCLIDADCDDLNECTDDNCTGPGGTCENTYSSSGTTCNGGFCNGNGTCIPNMPPSVDSIAIFPTTASTDTTLTCTATWSDPDNQLVTLAYAWKVDGISNSETTQMLDSTEFIYNNNVECCVTPNDGIIDGNPACDDIIISNTLPEVFGVNVSPLFPVVGDSLNCNSSPGFDIDDQSVSLLYEWYANSGSQQLGSQGPSYTASTYSPNFANITCEVTPWDGFDYGTTMASNPVEVMECYDNQDCQTLICNNIMHPDKDICHYNECVECTSLWDCPSGYSSCTNNECWECNYDSDCGLWGGSCVNHECW